MAKKSGPKTDNKMKNNKKKNKKSGPNKVAMKVQAPKADNPFESIWSRRKFDILGKKRKGEERRIGLARSQAIQKRKKTLLKEFEQRGKASVFIDKRIGEQNAELGEYDKAILRSQRERQLKLNKKSKYNLSDGEEEDFDIQGFGSIQGRDDFEDEVPYDDDDDAEPSGKSAILRFNAPDGAAALEPGLFKGDENRHKTKKEVMEEIISKSKFFKAQKAKEKEENEQLIGELDTKFESLRQSAGLESVKALAKKSGFIEHSMKELEWEKADSYDKLFGELRNEIRARPSDRTKTPEEIAQEEKERLEQLEEERMKRMHATDDSSDEDKGDDEELDNAMPPRSISGDDLGDSFTLDEDREKKRTWIEEILRKKNEEEESDDEDVDDDEDEDEDEDDDEDEDEDEENNENQKTQSLKDWEQSDDDLGTDLEEDDDGDEEDDKSDKGVKLRGDKISSDKSKKQAELLVAEKMMTSDKPSNEQEELPYTIPAPSNFEELSALLENRSDDQIIEAIKRIRTFNAISLAAENRKKMQVFYGVLLQYFAVSANKTPLNFKLLNLLVKPLVEMSIELPYFAAICARQRLLHTRTLLCEEIKNLDKSCWPNVKTLFLLRLWSIVFPCTDFRHVVMTPAILLMCEYLMRCPITCGRDIAIGSFLCSMVLSVTKQSRKFCPEAIAFLQSLLVAAINVKPGKFKDYQLCHLMELKALGPLLNIRTHVEEIKPLDFLELINMSNDSPFFSSDDFRASMLVSIIETLRGFICVYEGFNSFPEIFVRTSKLLNQLAEKEHTPIALRDKIKDVSDFIDKKIKEYNLVRQPLQMRKRDPVPIKLLNPKFEENFVKGRDYDPDRERAEMKKLKKLVKREAKGAARELRKDNYFLFEEKEKEKALLEEEKAEKYGKARAFLQEQEHAFKSGQLGKGKKRRR